KMDQWEKSSDHLVACGEALGITEMWCSSIISGGKLAPAEDIPPHNDTILAAMKRHPRRIRGWCFVIPGHYQAARDEIDRCLDAGMIGIKLYNQYWLDDPAVYPVIERAIERKVPILEHAGYPQPKFLAAQPLISHGKHFTQASKRYPEAVLIHAHIAGGGDWEHTVREMRHASRNVYIDVSGSNLDDGSIEFAVAEMGVERVLFGTDGTMAGSVGRVLEADLTEDQRELIFWGNAARILAPQGARPTESRDAFPTHPQPPNRG
ncbi:MAG: amidohydrolase family protein, partial [bacterium]|nr:amidohydrolase family protein [bacterium]